MTEPLSREKILNILKRELPYLRERYGVEQIALYGSFARDQASPTSDVDLLIGLSRPLGLEFVDLAEYLESMLGRSIHLATMDTLERSLQIPRYRAVALNIQESLIYA